MRDLFHLPSGGPYLLSHSVGCLPRRARAALEAGYLEPWQQTGGAAWGPWLETIEGFRAALAALIGADTAEVAPQQSVSAALFSFLSGLRAVGGRNRILMSEQAFPTVGFVAAGLERLGFETAFIPAARSPGDAANWESHIDGSVAAVVAMHVHSNTGVVSPLAEIAALARHHGAISVVDAAQSAGILPITPREWGVDAVIGSSVKWLCGGPGAAWLWLRRELAGVIEPLDLGWFGHEDPYAFDIRHFRHAADARRFQGGSPSIAPFALARAGIETILEIGQDEILRGNRACIAAFAEAVGRPVDMTDRGGTLCLAFDDPAAIASALSAQGFHFDMRGKCLRASFHAWNSPEEAALLGRTIADTRLAFRPAA
ncbi:aminotransferase class V-fold PLP-dependent enzyme [Novosphingobium aerophilum]|uniref:aminotransferase class V-fold PLP-dependent enzyme n=1 Tax=Novosphingobium TaxID=165696 RepID=UPI002D78D0D3|nr:aminotransferase class V-fold PLP-dependent enzyme [Novosphingobium sp. RL4]WRT95614.1 aminotransferase class V-fold PLP-dependent enzyme [Novosphingobium sp. RL4]